MVDSTSDYLVWRKRDLSGEPGSYKKTRYIFPSEDGRRWEIERTTPISGDNRDYPFVDAIAYPTSRSSSRTCPAGLKWSVYQIDRYIKSTKGVKVEIV